MRQDRKSSKTLFGPVMLATVLVLLAAMGTVVFLAGPTIFGRSAKSESEIRHDAVIASQQFVRQRVGPAYALEFNAPDWSAIEGSKETYTVTGWYSSIPRIFPSDRRAFGYTCKLRQLEFGGGWALLDLNIIPQ